MFEKLETFVNEEEAFEIETALNGDIEKGQNEDKEKRQTDERQNLVSKRNAMQQEDFLNLMLRTEALFVKETKLMTFLANTPELIPKIARLRLAALAIVLFRLQFPFVSHIFCNNSITVLYLVGCWSCQYYLYQLAELC